MTHPGPDRSSCWPGAETLARLALGLALLAGCRAQVRGGAQVGGAGPAASGGAAPGEGASAPGELEHTGTGGGGGAGAAPAPEAPPPAGAGAGAPGAPCPERRTGFNVFLGGPRSYVGAAFAYQPRCWVELLVGLGAHVGEGHATGADGTVATADVTATTLPLRARFWFMRRHSLLAEAGLGAARYTIDASQDDAFGSFEYFRTGTLGLAFGGVGYGFRSDGAFRLALILGGVVTSGALDPSDTETSAGYPLTERDALRADLDQITDSLRDAGAYGELSLGWMF